MGQITFLTLPPGKGKTLQAIEYAVKEAIEKRVVFITFEEDIESVLGKFREKILNNIPKDKEEMVNKNLKVYVFNQPIGCANLEYIICKTSPSVIVFDSIEWFGKKGAHQVSENAFIEYAQKKDIDFFVTKQSPKSEWEKFANLV